MESSPRPAARPVIHLRFEKFSSFVEEYASNLSLGGMFVNTPQIRSVGEVVGLEVELGDGFRLIEGVGEVAWVRARAAGADKPAGMALRFQALDEQGRELILKILEEQVRSGGEPFEVDEVPADAETGHPVVATAPEIAAAPARPAASTVPAAPAAPATPAAPAADSGSPDFEAPWGEGLPEIPQEFLGDDPQELPVAAEEEPAPTVIGPGVLARESGAEDGGPGAEDAPPVAVPRQTAEQPSPDLDRAPAPADAGPPPSFSDLGLNALAKPAASAEQEPTRVSEPRPAAAGTPSTDFEIGPRRWATTPASPAIGSTEGPRPAASFLPTSPPIPEPAPQPGGRPVVAGAASAAESTDGTTPTPAPGPIFDYEDDLFRDETPAGRPQAARMRRALAGGTRLLLALLLLAAIAGAFHYRQQLANLAGFASLIRDQAPAAGAPAAAEPSDTVRTPPPSPASDQDGDDPVPAPPPTATVATAHRVEDISWRSTAAGTEVTLRLNGQLGNRRITHDRLEWAPDREQVTLAGIDFPYSPGTLSVQSAELEQIRSGLHSAAGVSELRLVFDFTTDGTTISDLRELGDRVQVLVQSPTR